MKKLILSISLLLCISFVLNAQEETKQRYKVAIFAPLFLDSAFTPTSEYKHANTVFPKYINSGLEFYEGAKMAIDSLAQKNPNVDIYIYDTRSATTSLAEQLESPELENVDLIIAHCSSNEVRTFSLHALKKNVPVINATVPNDAGTISNAFFVILNPTLRTQCEGIYQYIQQHYAINPIVVFRRKGNVDDIVKNTFTDFEKITTDKVLRLKYVDLPDSFTVAQLKTHLDTTRKTICISGSLDVNFGKRLAKQLAVLNKSYPLSVIGMPTWDAISKDFIDPDFKGLEIIYSTPFYSTKTDALSQSINNRFYEEMYARPSDMVFRGFETSWKFINLLLAHDKELASHLGSNDHNLFTQFNIQPVLNRNTATLDYFENKKLYFIKWQDGAVKTVN